MLRNYLTIFLLSAFAISIKAEVCPPEEDLFPCSCGDYETNVISCGQSVPKEFDLKAHFDKLGQIVDSDTIFDRLYIVGTSLEEIPAGTFQTLKFRSIEFQSNNVLKYISPDAFGATLETTTNLDLGGNQYIYYPPYDAHDIFKVINKFKNVESVHIQQNHGLKTIPDSPFEYLPNLTYIRFGSCVLEQIGSRVFENLPKLQQVEFGYCDISINEFANDTFVGIGRDAKVDMNHNPFSRLPEHIFKPLLDNARSVVVGGQDCYWSWCTDVPFDCDEESEWICKNVTAYQPILSGFVCRAGSGYGDIWDYCADHQSEVIIQQ